MANSLRQTILLAAADSPLPLTSNQLFRKITPPFPTDIHNVVHQVWALQKTGELTFKERKGAIEGTGDLVDIVPTRFGARMAKKIRGEDMNAEWDRPYVTVTDEELMRGVEIRPAAATLLKKLAEKKGEPVDHGFKQSRPHTGSGQVHPVGRNSLDPSSYSQVAEGGPVTRETIPVESAPGPEPLSVLVFTGWDPDAYPLIRQVSEKESKANQAADLLLQAGLVDLAEQVMSAVVLTDLEKEVVKLVRQLKG